MSAGEKGMPNYLCFTALENGTFSYTFGKNQNTNIFQYISYSTDGINWTQITNVNNQEITGTTPTVEAGTKVYWKGVGVANSGFDNYSGYAGHFSSTGRFNVSGNICSSLFNDNFENIVLNRRTMFFCMFRECDKLVEADELVLPTSLYEGCFKSLFSGCSSLVKVPQLPTTALASGCYSYMFSGCSSLINAPALPATVLVNDCYYGMFYSCSSLIDTPQITINSVGNSSCRDMFNKCSALKNINITFNAMTLAESCYNSMFALCPLITTAPNLPATIIAKNCYAGMYKSCTKLVNVQDELPATTLYEGCYDSMFNSCSSLTKFVKLPATNTVKSCYRYMFYFTAATGKIELSATVLSQSCYEQMLRCNPTYIVMLGIDTSPSNCLNNWVYNIPNTPDRIFVKHIDATWTTTGNSGVPSNWTIIYYDPALDKYYTDQTRATECDDHGNPI